MRSSCLLITGFGSIESVAKNEPKPSKLRNKSENTQSLMEVEKEKEDQIKFNQKEEADRKMYQYLQGIKDGNPQLIVDLMDNGSRQYYGMERAQAAIEDYRIIFGNSNLLYKFESIDDSVPNEKFYRYLIYSDDGKEIRVNFITSKDGMYILGDTLLIYSWQAHHKMSKFIEALRNQNAQEVASALQEDDLWYPVREADVIVEKDREAFDLDSINYRLIGINEYDYFIYVISGSKNGVFKEHQLTIVLEPESQ